MANRKADSCDECAARRGEADDWRRMYQGLARGIAEAGAAGQPLSSVKLPTRKAAAAGRPQVTSAREAGPAGPDTVPVKREHIAMLYALARRPDFAEEYTTRDLLADFKAMQTIARAAFHEAGLHMEVPHG